MHEDVSAHQLSKAQHSYEDCLLIESNSDLQLGFDNESQLILRIDNFGKLATRFEVGTNFEGLEADFHCFIIVQFVRYLNEELWGHLSMFLQEFKSKYLEFHLEFSAYQKSVVYFLQAH